jgi:hypothetical protein
MRSSKEKQYVKFTENNEWEGEEWNFWIPVTGNESAIEQVRQLIADSETYSLSEKTFPESEVKHLVKHASDGYMASDQIASGFKTLPTKIDWEKEDPFYKAGLIEE